MACGSRAMWQAGWHQHGMAKSSSGRLSTTCILPTLGMVSSMDNSQQYYLEEGGGLPKPFFMDSMWQWRTAAFKHLMSNNVRQ